MVKLRKESVLCGQTTQTCTGLIFKRVVRILNCRYYDILVLIVRHFVPRLRDEVVKAVEAAKKKIDPRKLKHDPSKNLEKPPAGYNRNQVEEPGSGDEEDEDGDDENDYDSDFDDGGFYVRDSDEDEDEDGYRVFDWW